MRGLVVGILLLATVSCRDEGPNPVDPASVPAPSVVATIPVTSSFIHDSFFRDGLLFVCAWNNGVIIYDIGNGIRSGSVTSPIEVSRLVTGNSGLGGAYVHNAWWFHNPVTSEKRYLFIGQEGAGTIPTTSQGDIHVVDVSNLAAPVEVASYHMSGSPAQGVHNFWMDEPAQILYAAYYNGGVVALDVSGTLAGDIASREITRYKPATATFVWGVQLVGTSLYTTDFLNGLYQLRLNGSTFTTIGGGSNVQERYSSDLWVRSGYAYTGTWGSQPRPASAPGFGGARGNALKIWQLAANGAPTLKDSIVFDSVGTVGDVKGSDDGKLLILSTEVGTRAGLWVYSLADPARPTLVARTSVPGGVHTARIADMAGKRYVFAAKNGSGTSAPALLIFDVTQFAP